MKLAAVIGTVLAAAAVTCFPARAAESDGHVDFFLGQKDLNSDYWKPIGSQPEFGAVMSFGQDDWPVHIAVDVLLSVGQESRYDTFLGNTNTTGWTFEVDVGVRKIWKKGKVRPYLGGGLSSILTGLKSNSGGYVNSDERDQGSGVWAGTGVLFRLGQKFELGLDVRYSSSWVEFGDVYGGGLDGGGFQYGILLGFGF